MKSFETKYGVFTTVAPAGSVFALGAWVRVTTAIGRSSRIDGYYVRKAPETGFCYVLVDGGMMGGNELAASR